VSGFDLGKMLEEHLRAQEGIDIVDSDLVKEIQKTKDGFSVTTEDGESFSSKFLLITTGSHHRKLNIPGEKNLDGKGVVYCSTCDAPLFKDKAVAVVGGGNAGLEAVVDLFPYAMQIYLFETSPALKGDAVTQEKVRSNPKVQIFLESKPEEILGENMVSGLRYKNLATNEIKEIAVQGVFVEIGALPNSDIVKGLVELNPFHEIIVDHKTQKTSTPGIWAAGDVTDVIYKQNNISVGDAVKATLDIYGELIKK